MSAAEQLVEPWKPKRKVGGGDIPKLLGISPYGGPLEVYNRIINEIDVPWNRAMERGSAMEPVLRAMAQTAYGLKIIDRETDYHQHPGNDYAWAQIDDVAMTPNATEPAACDYKTQNKFAKGWGMGGTDEVPEHISAQLAWEMACGDFNLGLVVVGFGEDVEGPELFRVDRLVCYNLERNGPYETFLLATAGEFWRAHIIPRVPPAPTKGIKRNRK